VFQSQGKHTGRSRTIRNKFPSLRKFTLDSPHRLPCALLHNSSAESIRPSRTHRIGQSRKDENKDDDRASSARLESHAANEAPLSKARNETNKQEQTRHASLELGYSRDTNSVDRILLKDSQVLLSDHSRHLIGREKRSVIRRAGSASYEIIPASR